MNKQAAMGACCVQNGLLFLELGRTERGRIHISIEPHQGWFGSEPRPPLWLGLGPAVWSAPEFDGLYSHQPKSSAPAYSPNKAGVNTPYDNKQL